MDEIFALVFLTDVSSSLQSAGGQKYFVTCEYRILFFFLNLLSLPLFSLEEEENHDMLLMLSDGTV